MDRKNYKIQNLCQQKMKIGIEDKFEMNKSKKKYQKDHLRTLFH